MQQEGHSSKKMSRSNQKLTPPRQRFKATRNRHHHHDVKDPDNKSSQTARTFTVTRRQLTRRPPRKESMVVNSVVEGKIQRKYHQQNLSKQKAKHHQENWSKRRDDAHSKLEGLLNNSGHIKRTNSHPITMHHHHSLVQACATKAEGGTSIATR